MKGRLVLALMVSGVLVAPAARAQPSDGQTSDDTGRTSDDSQPSAQEIARGHFHKAQKFHHSGDYDLAAAAYLNAYRAFPAPAFLYNVGQVHRLAGRFDKALEYYRQYLELEPDGKGADDARLFIAELEKRLAESDPSSGASGPSKAGPKAGAGDAHKRTGESATSANGATAAAKEARWSDMTILKPTGGPSRDASTAGRTLRITGLAVAGVGVASLAVAGGFALRARSIDDSLSSYSGPWDDERQQEYQDGESARTRATVALVAGGVLVAGGAALYVTGRRRAASSPVDWSVAPTADGGAWAVVHGRF